MTTERRWIRRTVCAVTALCGAGLSITAWPHAFDNRYDLPAPLSYFVVGAAAAVGLSFLVTVWFVRRVPQGLSSSGHVVSLGRLLPLLRFAAGLLSIALFVLVIAAGWFGTRDPMMNLAPTLVWIVWWVGLSLVVAGIGNIWPALDPWRKAFAGMDTLARRLGRKNGAVCGWRYPQAIGAWPAVALLLGLGWFEVVYPEAAEPHRIASAALLWSAVTLLGNVLFGSETWRRNGDVFDLYFATLGRFAPAAPGPTSQSIILRPPGGGLMSADVRSPAMVGFVIAMLATVLFDGLLAGQLWWGIQGKVTRAIPLLKDDQGFIVGTLGLVGVWLIFLASYWVACAAAALLVRSRPVTTIAYAFTLSLVPIAIAYNIAHNCSSLLVQGQQLIPLLSDPLGRQWDLFGTASYRPRIGIIDARTTWYIAIGAIVAGHVISIWLAHRIALREFGTLRKAVLATIPLTVLMLIYTAISLSVIAEPMTKFGEPDQESAQSYEHWHVHYGERIHDPHDCKNKRRTT